MQAIHAVMCAPFVHNIFSEIYKKWLPYKADTSINFQHNYKPIILIEIFNFPNTQVKNFENQTFWFK